MPDDDCKIDIRHFPIPASVAREESLMQLVKHRRRVMRAIIIKDVSSEDLQAMRRLQAIEGYADLGMFVEAEDELHQLDPAWFGFKQIGRASCRERVSISV